MQEQLRTEIWRLRRDSSEEVGCSPEQRHGRMSESASLSVGVDVGVVVSGTFRERLYDGGRQVISDGWGRGSSGYQPPLLFPS